MKRATTARFESFLAAAQQALDDSDLGPAAVGASSTPSSAAAPTAVGPNIAQSEESDGCLHVNALSETEEDGICIDFKQTDKVLFDPIQASSDVHINSPALQLMTMLGEKAPHLYVHSRHRYC
eukprot:gb/GEZN01018834.1/.p1 GENE.gb/GEZN01018834.1/~~gb/GEZN01018834.1/.p1  ORF type:complete len:123 (-),score=10.94 gb/GEZN01018834.1/:198-566(-)